MGRHSVSNQLISLTSREHKQLKGKSVEHKRKVSNQLISLTSREKVNKHCGLHVHLGAFPIN